MLKRAYDGLPLASDEPARHKVEDMRNTHHQSAEPCIFGLHPRRLCPHHGATQQHPGAIFFARRPTALAVELLVSRTPGRDDLMPDIRTLREEIGKRFDLLLQPKK